MYNNVYSQRYYTLQHSCVIQKHLRLTLPNVQAPAKSLSDWLWSQFHIIIDTMLDDL
jgi:hypothetical protein